MNQNKRFMNWMCRILSVCFLMVSFQQSVMAGIITTAEIVNKQQIQLEKQRLTNLLSEQQLQSQLVSMGVDPADAIQRIKNMTDDEVQAFSAQMDELPAGSGVIELAVFIFLVLLVTDIMGYTSVFPFVKKSAR